MRPKPFPLSGGTCFSSGYYRVALTNINNLGSQHLDADAWKVWS